MGESDSKFVKHKTISSRETDIRTNANAGVNYQDVHVRAIGSIGICNSKAVFIVNHLRTGNLRTGTIANSEDPDEMPHRVAFHQSLHCLLRLNQSSEKEL